MDDAHAHIPAVLLQIAVGGNIKEVLGGGQLGDIDIPKVRPAALHQLQETVQLGGGQEGIDRVGEQQQFCGADGLHRAAHIPLKAQETGPHVEKVKAVLREALFQIQHRLQGDAVFPPGGAVDDADFHGDTPV